MQALNDPKLTVLNTVPILMLMETRDFSTMQTPSVPDIPPEVTALCQKEGFGFAVASELLKGGAISRTRRLTTTSQQTLILKQSMQAPPDLYVREAEGLAALTLPSAPRVPRVWACGASFLLLEDLGPMPTPTNAHWEVFGRAIATVHHHTQTRFGFFHDNYLGLLPQWNGWMEDGHAFFAHNRLLRYLREPQCEQTLAPEDRRALEQLCRRLPDLIPAQPASLLHGDLYRGNMHWHPEGQPAMMDPAVYYGWAEAELSMARQQGGIPDVFFAAYVEVHPLEAGWWERLELLYLREILSMIAHFGDKYGSLGKLRDVLAKFA